MARLVRVAVVNLPHHVTQRGNACQFILTSEGERLVYPESNPVRAGLVADAESWPWSSAKAHCGSGEMDSSLQMETWDRSA